jgi:hypothetical protein
VLFTKEGYSRGSTQLGPVGGEFDSGVIYQWPRSPGIKYPWEE